MTNSNPTIPQGSLANKQGSVLEQTIVPAFTSKGFVVISHTEWLKNPLLHGNELLLKNVPYTSIYGHSARTEYSIKSQRYNLEIRIECKWQQSSGSVDEKFPYLYLNCLQAMPEDNIFIIADGGGMKAGSLTWLRNAINTNLYRTEQNLQKNIRLFNLSQFVIWANTTLR